MYFVQLIYIIKSFYTKKIVSKNKKFNEVICFQNLTYLIIFISLSIGLKLDF